jgi:hypothetical protein
VLPPTRRHPSTALSRMPWSHNPSARAHTHGRVFAAAAPHGVSQDARAAEELSEEIVKGSGRALGLVGGGSLNAQSRGGRGAVLLKPVGQGECKRGVRLCVRLCAHGAGIRVRLCARGVRICVRLLCVRLL